MKCNFDETFDVQAEEKADRRRCFRRSLAGQAQMANSSAATPEDELYDIVIEGTGLTESILSAAAAWAGKKVIHVDKNSFYGSHWAALSISALDEWTRQHSGSGMDHLFHSLQSFNFLCRYIPMLLSNAEETANVDFITPVPSTILSLVCHRFKSAPVVLFVGPSLMSRKYSTQYVP